MKGQTGNFYCNRK